MERDLKEYIVKLNDRNIQRQRESGFTLYAILAAIIYCVFYMIDNIGIAYEIETPSNFAICVFTSNLLFIMFLFYLSYLSTTNRTYVSKIFPYQEPLSFDLGDLTMIISCAVISVVNFKCLELYDEGIQLVFLWIFMVIPMLNAASPFLFGLYKAIRKYVRKKKKQSTDPIDFTYNPKITKSAVISLLFYGILLSIIYLFTWIETSFDVWPETASGIIKYTVCFFSLLFLVKLAIDIHENQNYNHLLEEFEKEIFYENIDNKEIAKRSESMFFGIPIKRWLSNKEQEIITFFDERRKASLLQDVHIIAMGKMTTQDEIDSIIKTVKDAYEDSKNISKDYIQKISRNFNDLNRFAYLDDDEEQQLRDLLIALNGKIREFNGDYSQQLKAMQKQLIDFSKKYEYKF